MRFIEYMPFDGKFNDDVFIININPFTPKISLAILLTVCDTILMMLAVRIFILDKLIIP